MIKANKKKLRRKGYKFRDEEGEAKTNGAQDPAAEDTKVNDAEVMSYFTLPAEYAFVARAISQMDGVGKSLDPEFDFISSAAPYIVEIKGADLYLKDEASKVFRSFGDKLEAFVESFRRKLQELLRGR